jgi:hypothetical protein
MQRAFVGRPKNVYLGLEEPGIPDFGKPSKAKPWP